MVPPSGLSVGCGIRGLEFRLFTNAHGIDGTEINIRLVYLDWKFIYFLLNPGADLHVERQDTKCGDLSDVD